MDATQGLGQVQEIFDKFGTYVTTGKFWISVVLIVVAIVAWRLLKHARKKWKEKNGTMSTLSNVLFDIARFLFIFIVIIVLLQLNGVNVTAMITGLGVVSAIVGLALQDFLKDMIMGVHILTDKFFQIGDVVRYNGYEGEVISFNIRTTKIKSVQYGEIITICNRNISEIEVLSDMFDLDIGLGYYTDAKLVHQTMQVLADRIAQIEGVTKCIYKGTSAFNDSSITYKLRYFTSPKATRFDIRRKAHMIVQDGLAEAGISFPYNHLDVELVGDSIS